MNRVDPPTHLDRRLCWMIRTRAGLWLPFLIQLPTLTGPFVLDDLYMIRRIERFNDGELDHPALFEFIRTPEELRAQRDRTTFCWWLGVEGTTRFFRPLAEASFRVDYLCFERNVLGYRLVSLAWFVLALMLVRRLLTYAGAGPSAVELGTLIFGIAQAVAMPVGFISNRADLMVIVGVVTASIALRRAPSAANGVVAMRSALLLALLGYGFALCCKEAAAPLALVWLMHAWIERRRHTTWESRARWTFAVLALGVAVAYAIMYVSLGYGVYGPPQAGGSLIELIRDTALQAGLLLTVWMLGLPGLLAVIVEQRAIAWGMAAAAALIGLAFLSRARPLWRESSAFRFFALWAVCFSLPPLLATPEPRMLCVAGVGWAACLAQLLTSPAPRPGVFDRLLREWLIFANGAAAVGFGVGSVLYVQQAERRCQDHIRDYAAAAPRGIRDGDVLVVEQPRHMLELIVPGDRFEFVSGCDGVRLHYLTVDGVGNLTRRVEDERTILIASDSPRLFGSALHPRTAPDGESLRVGTRWENRDFSAEIAEMKGARVTALRFRFARPLAADGQFFHPPLGRGDTAD